MNKKWIIIASLNGAIAVSLGALASHYLKGKIPADSIANFKLASQYQMIHALLMLVMSYLSKDFPKLKTVLNTLLLGIVFFSGSIYILSSKIVTGTIFAKILGPLTPLGGILIIFSWIWLAYIVLDSNKDKKLEALDSTE